jgi:hypothetical protein
MENVSINMTVSLPKLPAMGLNAEFDLRNIVLLINLSELVTISAVQK